MYSSINLGNKVQGFGLDSTSSGHRPVAGSCKHSNERLFYIVYIFLFLTVFMKLDLYTASISSHSCPCYIIYLVFNVERHITQMF